eukprot:TRINITY_DN1438_c2_g1_i2.p1 TRINITY_DN1438_c2_g1~~TRINITY_DN1438_c2_g1_i2.p1  ORF type:complete len:208 (-),score=77.36 TRINITY_DN1438_c2_g1_i2:101-724(-)
MKPAKIKHLLSQYGEVERIYLTPELDIKRKRRVKQGGNTRKKYVDGWVEFSDKRIAKRVAAMLNNTNIGGKKKSWYYHDMWNIKYLSRFKWSDLSEKISYDNAVRKQRMQQEMRQAKSENAFYLEKVAQSKARKAVEERKKRKLESGDHEDDDQGQRGSASEIKESLQRMKEVKRTFRQRKQVGKEDDEEIDLHQLATQQKKKRRKE